MPVTTAAVLEVFRTLLRGGTKPHERWTPGNEQADMAATARIWADVLVDLDDARLKAAAVAFLATGEARWWPHPGAIGRRAAPTPLQPIRAPVAESNGPFTDDLDDWGRQHVLDEAEREDWWSLDLTECWRRMDDAARKLLQEEA